MNNHQQGLSLFEVLVAILLLSIGLLGLVNFQSAIGVQWDRAREQQQGERIAFQLLEIYPDPVNFDLPKGWSYRVVSESDYPRCQRVKAIVQPNLGKRITQERWFCR